MQDTPFSLDPVETTPQQSWSSRLLIFAAVATVAIGAAVSGYGGYALWQMQNQEISPIVCLESPTEAAVYIDVSGAVKSPGVYKIQDGGRVADAVAAAGGLLTEADPEYVHQSLNMAHNVTDGQKIYIPTKEERAAVSSEVQPQQVESTKPAASSEPSVGAISINQATATQLETLPGIGPARAKAIIDARPFSSIQELLERKLLPATVFSEISAQIHL